MTNYFRDYKDRKAKAPAKVIPDERLRQNALSATSGLAAQPKDFDWVTKNIPCQAACPAGTDIPGYLGAVAAGDFETAYRINLADNVFPAVLGRVCTRPCEPACRHGWEGLGEPVAICFSKRSAADFASRAPVTLEPWYPSSGKSVVVVGAGAAGLAAARDLALLGHAVTVLEKHEKPGGMMIQGIPEFRLPRDLVEKEIEQIRLQGVEIRCGVDVGSSAQVSDLLKQHDAVILAAGTHQPNRPALPGVQLAGVQHGLEFLRQANTSGDARVGERVVVIGGGFTAVDCARMAKRLGAESVRMLYRRSEKEMYVTPGEVEEMAHEGIAVETLSVPVEFLGEGSVRAVRFRRAKTGKPDSSGRASFEEVAGTEFDVDADTVLLATGQKADSTWLTASDASNAKLFRTGDFAAGARSLIDAIADGKKCARAVDALLMNETRLTDAVLVENAAETGRTREMDAIPRQAMPVLDLATRQLRAEVEKGFSEADAKTEASRCYLCHFKYEIDNDLCIYCDRCLKVKPVENCIVKVSSLIYDEEDRIVGFNRSSGSKDYNMLYIDQSQCIRCGACKEVCPVECISLQKAGRITVRTGDLNR